MKRTRLLLIALLTLALPPLTQAKYLYPETRRVPTERLIANLEEKLKAAPKSNELRHTLARVHSIAYAGSAADFEVSSKDETPYFGPGTSAAFPPSNLNLAADAGLKHQAREHLKKAIEHYRAVTTADTNHLYAALGMAWCLDQAGDKKAALDAYRKALDLAWKREGKTDSMPVGGCATDEIARYMLKLLDPVQDAGEIARVKGYQTALAQKSRWITPILIPLESDATLEQLVNPGANVHFDLDGSGLDRRWGWITPQAGWLVYDHDGCGEITSGLQMIGSVTFWVFWQNGYHALASLDSDNDGVLRGDELKGLAIWHDANSNGASEPGEVKPLAAWGITALSSRYETHATGIPFSPRGVVFKDGSTRASYDWIAPGR